MHSVGFLEDTSRFIVNRPKPAKNYITIVWYKASVHISAILESITLKWPEHNHAKLYSTLNFLQKVPRGNFSSPARCTGMASQSQRMARTHHAKGPAVCSYTDVLRQYFSCEEHWISMLQDKLWQPAANWKSSYNFCIDGQKQYWYYCIKFYTRVWYLNLQWLLHIVANYILDFRTRLDHIVLRYSLDIMRFNQSSLSFPENLDTKSLAWAILRPK